jgi:leucyl-tRNA synthetase
MSAALPEKEMEWNDKGVNSNYKIIQKILATSIKVKNTDSFKIKTQRDGFLISKLNFAIKECEINLENYEFNFAITKIVSLLNYMSKFEDEITKEVFDYSFKRCIIMLAPFIPHSCEEIWERLGNKSFISLEKWPIFDESKIDLKIENMEKMTDNLIKDIHDIIELTKKIPKEIKIFVSNEWKYSLCNLIRIEGIANPKLLIQKAMNDSNIKMHGKEAINIIGAITKDMSKLAEISITQKEEIELFELNKKYIEKEFSAKIKIINADESAENKAKSALPGKPGILIE